MEKFEFNVPFQWEIIKHILLDKNGYKVLTLVSYEYFDLDYQKVIVRSIQRYFKRKSRIPPASSYLMEEVRYLFRTKDYAKLFTEIDRAKVQKKIRILFKSPPKDPEEVYEKIKTFASFVMMRKALEDFDVGNYEQYTANILKLQKAVNIGQSLNEKKGSLMVSASRIRILDRHQQTDIIPTPWVQLNSLTNAGGYTKGSIICIVDRPKKGKTLGLINIACAYAKNPAFKANKIIYFDLENGETAITTRMDQCLVGASKHDILSGELDQKLNKTYRKLARFKSEIYVVRMPAYATTLDFIKEMDDIEQEYGIKFKVAIVDYIGIMGATSGKTEDHLRISDAYIDVKNMAKAKDLDIVYTGHHVTRAAYGRRSTKYKPDDLAKCIDIERHVDALFGMQQSEEDVKMGLLRWEIIEQRDGIPFGRVVFKQNTKFQRIKPLPSEDLKEYNFAYGNIYNEGTDEDEIKDRKARANKSKSDLD